MTQARSVVATLVLVCAASDARAGGMILPMRGVRAVERAGALVAGADDADALWLDPAGLARLAGDGHRQLLFDAAYVYQTVDYTRIINGGTGGGTALPRVSNQQPGQALPTLAAALGIGDRLVIAGGLSTPYAGLHTYGSDGAQRYASANLQGSAFVYLTFGAAYKVSDRLRIGATVTDAYAKIASQIVVSACPGAMLCAPEDRQFDAVMKDAQTDYVSPTGSLGVQYDVARGATIGLAVQAPSRVSATGTFTLQLPSTALFDGAHVVGNQSDLAFTLPAVVRAGIELRPTAALRIEAALDVELWSTHDAITISPHDVRVDTATASYPVSELVIPRHYQTSFAPAIAVEWHGPSVMLGAGYCYETAAAAPGYVSVLTVDSAKHILGLGGGYEADGWQIGASVGLAALADVSVSLSDAKVTQLTPLGSSPGTTTINAGSYQSRYLVAGLRFARQF